MKYDKKSINAVKKQGVFDSSMDSQILEMDDMEKQKLSHKLKDHVKPISEDKSSLLKNSNKQVLNKKEKIDSLSLWDRIVYIIRKFLYSESIETFIKKIEIKKLKKKVGSFNPLLYHIRTDKISVEFCELINVLAAQVLEIKKIFEVCQNPNPKEKPALGSFEEFFMWQYIEDIPNFSEKFNHESIKKNSNLFKETLIRETIEKEIDAYFNFISADTRRLVNYSYANLLGFERLSEFNYVGFLKKCSVGFDVFNDQSLRNKRSSFKPIQGSDILFELKRIEGLLYSIDFDSDLNTPFNLLFKYFNLNESSDEEPNQNNEEAENNRVQALLSSIRSIIEDEKLASIIKLIMKNPERVSQLKVRKVNLIEKVRLILIDKYINHCNKIVNQLEITDLNKQVKMLFAGSPLSFLEFYNDATNRKLISLELPFLTHFKQIQIIKTFGEKLFIPVIKPALNVLLVDGDFIDKRMYQNLSDFFYNYNLMDRQILDFENSISSKSSEGEKLHSALNNYDADIINKKYLTEKIGYLNHMVAKILREFVFLFQNTLPALKAVMRDASSDKDHELVDNIKSLGGAKHKSILMALSQAEKSVGIICEMLQSYKR